MTIPYSDNLEATPVSDVSCMVEVERIYLLDWGRFDVEHGRRLAQVYDRLPGAIRNGDSPCWFGDDEDVPPYLFASAEPSGLLVSGVLPEADWQAWDGRFRAAAAGLPCRTPG